MTTHRPPRGAAPVSGARVPRASPVITIGLAQRDAGAPTVQSTPVAQSTGRGKANKSRKGRRREERQGPRRGAADPAPVSSPLLPRWPAEGYGMSPGPGAVSAGVHFVRRPYSSRGPGGHGLPASGGGGRQPPRRDVVVVPSVTAVWSTGSTSMRVPPREVRRRFEVGGDVVPPQVPVRGIEPCPVGAVGCALFSEPRVHGPGA